MSGSSLKNQVIQQWKEVEKQQAVWIRTDEVTVIQRHQSSKQDKKVYRTTNSQINKRISLFKELRIQINQKAKYTQRLKSINKFYQKQKQRLTNTANIDSFFFAFDSASNQQQKQFVKLQIYRPYYEQFSLSEGFSRISILIEQEELVFRQILKSEQQKKQLLENNRLKEQQKLKIKQQLISLKYLKQHKLTFPAFMRNIIDLATFDHGNIFYMPTLSNIFFNPDLTQPPKKRLIPNLTSFEAILFLEQVKQSLQLQKFMEIYPLLTINEKVFYDRQKMMEDMQGCMKVRAVLTLVFCFIAGNNIYKWFLARLQRQMETDKQLLDVFQNFVCKNNRSHKTISYKSAIKASKKLPLFWQQLINQNIYKLQSKSKFWLQLFNQVFVMKQSFAWKQFLNNKSLRQYLCQKNVFECENQLRMHKSIEQIQQINVKWKTKIQIVKKTLIYIHKAFFCKDLMKIRSDLRSTLKGKSQSEVRSIIRQKQLQYTKSLCFQIYLPMKLGISQQVTLKYMNWVEIFFPEHQHTDQQISNGVRNLLYFIAYQFRFILSSVKNCELFHIKRILYLLMDLVVIFQKNGKQQVAMFPFTGPFIRQIFGIDKNIEDWASAAKMQKNNFILEKRMYTHSQEIFRKAVFDIMATQTIQKTLETKRKKIQQQINKKPNHEQTLKQLQEEVKKIKTSLQQVYKAQTYEKKVQGKLLEQLRSPTSWQLFDCKKYSNEVYPDIMYLKYAYFLVIKEQQKKLIVNFSENEQEIIKRQNSTIQFSKQDMKRMYKCLNRIKGLVPLHQEFQEIIRT